MNRSTSLPLLIAASWVLILSIAAAGQSKRLETQAIRAVRASLMRDIEPGLPRQRLDQWFRKTVGKNMRMSWEVNDCGEQTGTPADRGRDFPMCVEAAARSFDVHVSIALQVGTFKKGISRTPPVVRSIAIHIEGEGAFQVENLSSLRKKLLDLGVDVP